MTIVRLGAIVVSSSPAARQFFFIYIYILIEMREKDIEKVVGASSARMEKIP